MQICTAVLCMQYYAIGQSYTIAALIFVCRVRLQKGLISSAAQIKTATSRAIRKELSCQIPRLCQV